MGKGLCESNVIISMCLNCINKYILKGDCLPTLINKENGEHNKMKKKERNQFILP